MWPKYDVFHFDNKSRWFFKIYDVTNGFRIYYYMIYMVTCFPIIGYPSLCIGTLSRQASGYWPLLR